MAVTGYRLNWLATAAGLALAQPACSFLPLETNGGSPAALPASPTPVKLFPMVPTAADTVLPHEEEAGNLPASPGPTDVQESLKGDSRADFWDRLHFDGGLALDDARNFYSVPNLGALALGIAAAAPLANTSADRHFRNWYQDRVKTTSLNTPATVATYAGQLWVIAPVALEVTALLGKADDDYWHDGGVYEWSNRSLRAIALGYPPAVALYGVLGSGRPDRNDSRWHPFRYFHGVSGHTFIGAVPFLTAAAMTDNLLLQAPLVAGSFVTGWAHSPRRPPLPVAGGAGLVDRVLVGAFGRSDAGATLSLQHRSLHAGRPRLLPPVQLLRTHENQSRGSCNGSGSFFSAFSLALSAASFLRRSRVWTRSSLYFCGTATITTRIS